MNQNVLSAKQAVVSEISEKLKNSESTVVVEYRGLTVAEVTELRRNLRAENVEMKVYKNTMVERAAEECGYSELKEALKGPNAFAFSTDATAPARVLCKFAKNAPALEIKGGVVDGVVYDAKGIAQLADIPSKEELLSRLLGSMKSPISNLARVLNQIAEKGGAGNCEAAPAAEETPAAEEALAEAPAETTAE